MNLRLFLKSNRIDLHRLYCLLLFLTLAPVVKAGLQEAPADTNTVNLLNKKAPTFWSSKPDSTIILATEALELSLQLHYVTGQMQAFRNLGIGHYEKGNYSEAIKYYQRAIAHADALNDDAFGAQLRSNISLPYLTLGAHDDALKNLYTALEIAEKNDLHSTQAHATHNIGMVYHYQFKNDQAIDFYEKSRHLYESKGDTSRSTFILTNIAHLYLQKEDFRKAEELYRQSLALAEKQDNKKAIGNALQSLGALFLKQQDPQAALPYLLQAKEILEATGEQTEYLRLMDNLANCYMDLGDRQAAYTTATQNFEIASRQQQLYYIKTAGHQLSELYAQQGNHDIALDYFKKATQAADSLYSRENKEELVRMEEKYAYQKDQEQTALLHDMELKRQRLWLYGAIATTVVLLVIALLLVSNIRQKRRTNRILKETNEFFEEQNTLLEDANHFKEQLISLVAHDVRQPIASLQHVLSLFGNDHLSADEIRQLMVSSHRDVTSLVRLLDDLLLWVKLQLNDNTLQKTTFDLPDVIEPAVELFQSKATEKNILLEVQHGATTKVYADREAIATVVRNLIDNGIKFSKPGDRLLIRTEPAEGKDRVLVLISDTGIGMSNERIYQLFSSPAKAKRNGTHKEEGSGLGIQICMHYLQLNNSELFIDSKTGRGSTCWFELDMS